MHPPMPPPSMSESAEKPVILTDVTFRVLKSSWMLMQTFSPLTKMLPVMADTRNSREKLSTSRMFNRTALPKMPSSVSELYDGFTRQMMLFEEEICDANGDGGAVDDGVSGDGGGANGEGVDDVDGESLMANRDCRREGADLAR